MEDLLGQGRIALHPFVFGELLLSGLPKSGPFSPTAFGKLAPAAVATLSEVAAFILWAKLAGQGVGYVDVHVLLSARLMEDASILTQDGNLHAQAKRFGLLFAP